MTSVYPSSPLYIIFHTCFRIVLTISSCSEILLNCNQQWKKSVFTPWQTITDILLVFKIFNFETSLRVFSYFRIFETLLLAGVAYKTFDRKSRGYRPIMVQYYVKKTNEGPVFESHVTVWDGHALVTCPCAEFFRKCYFWKYYYKEAYWFFIIVESLYGNIHWKYSLKFWVFSSFLGFFLEIPLSEILYYLHTTNAATAVFAAFGSGWVEMKWFTIFVAIAVGITAFTLKYMRSQSDNSLLSHFKIGLNLIFAGIYSKAAICVIPLIAKYWFKLIKG